MSDLRLYLGTHMPSWLWDQAADFPLFVSRRRLAKYRTLRPSTGPWALDSGGFTELSAYGGWRTGPEEYADDVARYQAEIGQLEWAAPQDWMCEPGIIAGTGLSVREHQARTVDSFLTLTDLWPGPSPSPFIPVLQGWATSDYVACARMYADAGVQLEGRLVGLGSVCRRQATSEIGALVRELAPLELHGFGVKTKGLQAYGHMLAAADSMAWSFDARRSRPLPGHTHGSCANCLPYASAWRSRVLQAYEEAQAAPRQGELAFA